MTSTPIHTQNYSSKYHKFEEALEKSNLMSTLNLGNITGDIFNISPTFITAFSLHSNSGFSFF